MIITIKSPAKINLSLKIIRKRKDNYHDIETLFQMVDLCDEIHLKEINAEENIRILSDHPGMPTNSANLVYKAVELFRDKYRIKRGLEVRIKKNIPIAAGLGGGSSNAAATLLGLNFLWKIGAKREDLMSLSEKIGADVPFFLFGPCAMGYGRGDRLKAKKVTGDFFVILANPEIEVSAAWAYQRLSMNLTNRTNNDKIKAFDFEIDIQKLVPGLVNDLEGAVIEKHPIISDIKKRLFSLGAVDALMSGSGSTVFGIFIDKEVALSAAKKCNWSDCHTFLVSPVRELDEIYPEVVLQMSRIAADIF